MTTNVRDSAHACSDLHASMLCLLVAGVLQVTATSCQPKDKPSTERHPTNVLLFYPCVAETSIKATLDGDLGDSFI